MTVVDLTPEDVPTDRVPLRPKARARYRWRLPLLRSDLLEELELLGQDVEALTDDVEHWRKIAGEALQRAARAEGALSQRDHFEDLLRQIMDTQTRAAELQATDRMINGSRRYPT